MSKNRESIKNLWTCFQFENLNLKKRSSFFSNFNSLCGKFRCYQWHFNKSNNFKTIQKQIKIIMDKITMYCFDLKKRIKTNFFYRNLSGFIFLYKRSLRNIVKYLSNWYLKKKTDVKQKNRFYFCNLNHVFIYRWIFVMRDIIR